jgi:hypothetical protein
MYFRNIIRIILYYLLNKWNLVFKVVSGGRLQRLEINIKENNIEKEKEQRNEY